MPWLRAASTDGRGLRHLFGVALCEGKQVGVAIMHKHEAQSMVMGKVYSRELQTEGKEVQLYQSYCASEEEEWSAGVNSAILETGPRIFT